MSMKSYSLVVVVYFGLLFSCKNQDDWLDAPRSKNDKLIESLNDCQGILNNTSVFNIAFPSLGLASTDNIYIQSRYINNVNVIERNAYLWNADVYEGLPATDYNSAYKVINHSNVILEFLSNLGSMGDAERLVKNDLAGQAYFFRAYMFYELSSLYCKQFNMSDAENSKGLCLKLSSNINELVKRSTLKQTFSQIIDDIRKSIELLSKEANFKTRPTKFAAYALMARVLLNMNDFAGAKLYADSALSSSARLIDFATVPNLSRPFRFPDFQSGNAEIIFYGCANLFTVLFPNDNVSLGLVDTLLYRSYSDQDLRKVYFYNTFDSVTIKFKGSYAGIGYNFHGLGINEMMLIKAECEVRSGDLGIGVKFLNDLLVKRFKPGTYQNYETLNRDSALLKILSERRKELPFTAMIRWQDLRRLNTDPRLATIITRIIDGKEIKLNPQDLKYVFPIPQSEIDFAGIEQNER